MADRYTDNALDQHGFIPADMAVNFVLKPQSQLTAADNKKYAQIDAISFTTDLSPESVAANEKVAGDQLADLEMIEAHASGFAKEMAIEAAALPTMQAKTKAAKIDTTKRVFGHGFSASGVASIIGHAASKFLWPPR